MGRMKELATDPQEYFVDDDPSYLTLARIMNREWRLHEKENVWGKGFTGFAEIAIQDAFKAGFMKGFEGRYFEQTDN